MAIISKPYGTQSNKPSPHNRGSVSGVAVGLSIVISGIAMFAGHFELGVVTIVFCLVVAFLHANAEEPGNSRAPIATGFLAASAVCAALFAVAGAKGVAINIETVAVTALYGAGLAFGVFARLEWFHRVVSVVVAVALVALVIVLPKPPSPTQPDPTKSHIEVTVYDANVMPVQGAAVACSALRVNYLEDLDRETLRAKLDGGFEARTDEAGHATIDLDAGGMEFFFCVAAMPQRVPGEVVPPPAFSDLGLVPIPGSSVPVSVHFYGVQE